MKRAILQMADQGPTESTVIMLRAAGYEVSLPNDELRALLRSIGCNVVLSPKQLTAQMGYDPVDLPEVGPKEMDRADLYCDVKAHQCHDLIVNRWPNLRSGVLWTRINGGKPEHVIRRKPCPNCCGVVGDTRGCSLCKDTKQVIDEDCGDEVNPPCPVLTPNLWYRDPKMLVSYSADENAMKYNSTRFYACWPPFARIDEYGKGRHDFHQDHWPPLCLIHNVEGWGYGRLIDGMRKQFGVRCFGAGSPDGLIQHKEVKVQLARALCMVHLKSSDAPGYALLEALAAGCPIVCTRRLIWRCRMEDMLIPGETCLTFDRETHDGLTDTDVESCLEEVGGHLQRLRDPVENRRIGDAGRAKLVELSWSPDRAADVESLRAFFKRNFPS